MKWRVRLQWPIRKIRWQRPMEVYKVFPPSPVVYEFSKATLKAAKEMGVLGLENTRYEGEVKEASSTVTIPEVKRGL